MSSFIVAIFPDASSAVKGQNVLNDLASRKVIQLDGAAMIKKGDEGKLIMQVTADDGPAIAATGALIGGLAGLAIGPLATAVLAAGGAVYGASAGLTNRGAGMAFAEQVTQDLAPGLTALVAEMSTEDPATLVSRLEAAGGTVTRQQTLSEE